MRNELEILLKKVIEKEKVSFFLEDKKKLRITIHYLDKALHWLEEE